MLCKYNFALLRINNVNRKEIGLKIDVEKMRLILKSRLQNTRQNLKDI